MAKSKAYVVWAGFKPGIYTSWPECQKQVSGFSGAKYKGFPSLEEAKQAFSGEPAQSSTPKESSQKPTGDFLTVDAAFSQRTRILEWRGVLVEGNKRTEVFHSGEHIGGSANIGEFLAIIDGIDYLRSKGMEHLPIYSDSYNAQLWVRRKAHNANVEISDELSYLLRKANERLYGGLNASPKDRIVIKDWVTKSWGEIPADFGRK